jgi:serine/threonine protein kinase
MSSPREPTEDTSDSGSELVKTLADLPWHEAGADHGGVLVDEESGLSGAETPARPRRVAEPNRPGMGRVVLRDIDRSGARPILRERATPRYLFDSPGASGETVAAMDQDVGRPVAIKRQESAAQTAEIRLTEEIRTLGRLDHPNVLPIYDVGRDTDGTLFAVTRHLAGDTLESVIARLRAGDAETHRRFGFERRVGVMTDVLRALSHAHARGIVHRNLRPANVLVGRNGEVILVDWGVSRLLDADPDADTEEPRAPSARGAAPRVAPIVGTPAYLGPEHARGEPADFHADLYAVSVMLHELLTLQHYLADCASPEAMLAAIARRPVPMASDAVSPHQARVPKDLAWFVQKGVDKDPSARYLSADEMLERLARRAEGDIPVQCHVTLAMRASAAVARAVDQNPVASVVVAGAGVGLVLLVFGVLLVR